MAIDTREPSIGDIEQKYALGVLQEQVRSGQSETSRRLERIEKKIDEQHFVSQSVFDAYREEVERRVVTQDQFKPVKWFFYTAASSIIGAVIVALVTFIVKGGLG